MKIGDVTISYANHLLITAERLGASRELLLAQNHLPPNLLEDGNERFDLVDFMRLGYSAIKMTGQSALGLHLGGSSTITRLGYPALAAMTSPNLGEALRIITHYEHISGRCYRGTSSIVQDPSETRLQFYSIAPYNDYTCFVVDTVLSTWNALIQRLTEREDLIQEVRIEFPEPSYSGDYKNFFSCPVTFNQDHNALILAPGAMETPMVHKDSHLYHSLLEQCDHLLSQVTLSDSFCNKVLKALGTMLHDKSPTIGEIAQQLGIPIWTMRRKLKEEGTSYQNLVDQMRKDVALSYIKNTDLSFGEIAYLLGFSTPGAFQRAFKRWTGKTPGEYRKSM